MCNSINCISTVCFFLLLLVARKLEIIYYLGSATLNHWFPRNAISVAFPDNKLKMSMAGNTIMLNVKNSIHPNKNHNVFSSNKSRMLGIVMPAPSNLQCGHLYLISISCPA